MISVFLIFIFSCLVSFVGSLQLGPVNLFVINAALYKDTRTAYLVAIGGCIPEFMYCAIAVFANNYLLKYEWLIMLFKVTFIIIMAIVGFMFYFKKQSSIEVKDETTVDERPTYHIVKGFSLAGLNPQLLLFWIFIQVYFNSIPFLQITSNAEKWSYILGSGIGAFTLLAFFIYVVTKYRKAILKYINNTSYYKVLSLLFFAIAGHQVWMLINS